MTIRLLIVDDHPVVRDGLRGMLQNHDDFEVVGEAANGHQALAALKDHPADVVLMDLRMPELDGVTTTMRMQQDHPGVRVLVLTTFDDDSDIVRAIGAGATGYLLKDTPRETLFDAIRQAAGGQTVLAPGVAARLIQRRAAGPNLSSREVEVLRLVAKGLTNRAIAGELHVSEATVKTHLVNSFAKLGVDDRTAAVMAAMAAGLLTSDP